MKLTFFNLICSHYLWIWTVIKIIIFFQVFIERFRLRRNWLGAHCHIRTFEGHEEGVSCVQFDDSRIVSGSHDNTIKVWNRRTNSQWSVQTLVGHSGMVRCLHLADKRIVSGSADRTIKVFTNALTVIITASRTHLITISISAQLVFVHIQIVIFKTFCWRNWQATPA